MKRTINEGFVRRMDHVVWKVIEGKGILLNLENGAYFDIDPVGLTIWQLCDGKTRFREIISSTSLKFKTDDKRVSRDVFHFVNELKRNRLIEIIPTPTRAIARA